MNTLLRLLLKSQHERNRSGPAQTDKGMTLVELLVGSIMAFLIITPMLSFVVDMLNTDRREQVKSNTEQDLQAAVDFIAQDLSQAIYIYDNNTVKNGTPNTTPTGIPAIKDKLPANGIPVLVFLKQKQMKNSLPINKETAKTVTPANCGENEGKCNDTYVLSIVAYYQIQEKDKNSIWCQPSGGDFCPARIVRYEIRDGLRNPDATNVKEPYYAGTDDVTDKSQRKSLAFNKDFDPSNPTKDVAESTDWGSSEVLVNYIDHSPGPTPIDPKECQTALGNPIDQRTATAIGEATLRIPSPDDKINSFYACVDTEKNIARVTIRGNSLRRLQANDADFKTTSSAFFPTATVQVKGLGARGN